MCLSIPSALSSLKFCRYFEIREKTFAKYFIEYLSTRIKFIEDCNINLLGSDLKQSLISPQSRSLGDH